MNPTTKTASELAVLAEYYAMRKACNEHGNISAVKALNQDSEWWAEHDKWAEGPRHYVDSRGFRRTTDEPGDYEPPCDGARFPSRPTPPSTPPACDAVAYPEGEYNTSNQSCTSTPIDLCQVEAMD